jgi:hypothetical protein
MFRKPTTQEKILKEYQKLKKTKSGRRHYDQYYVLRNICMNNEDDLLALVLYGGLTKSEQADFIHIGMDGASLNREANSQWWEFIGKVREQKELLDISNIDFLDWLLEVHGW